MSHAKDSLNGSEKERAPLEVEIMALREEVKQLRAENTAAKAKLKEQEAIEKRYEESQSRFAGIFDRSIMGNKIIGPDLKIKNVNKALQQMLGYSKAELIGIEITKLSHPDFVHHWQELRQKLWEEKIPAFQLDTCLLQKDGSGLWCQVTSILFQDQHEWLGFTIIENISNRKALEQQLKKQYENQETIMHMIAHDLKSPLFNIYLAAGFLRENLEQLQANEQKKQEETSALVNLISDTSDKALLLIKDLLLIGEVESTQEDLEETDLKAFIQFHLQNLSVGAQNKNIAIEFQTPKKPVYAFVNREKFRRVLENLVSNAIKFTQPNGQVNIILKNNGKHTMLYIQDNGIGIPESLQATIFQKFTKAGRNGTAGEPTTGLGLYIVKQIIEKHQGTIRVESQENAGATFIVELPAGLVK
ncbi:sensor histidine kinase [Adhaeribacter pallidiroseus]|uniref:histidine kinase n=1 Tax=Adhaeribacter pallidiroseus TaxID=2072847 RepID=A0A369QPR1_9BACT|nr:HAMP domain-containing sensor histidine kinase [Adhaeribacter pallidiroseus]RDC65237.1 Histidine kinase [Adhaeribacter pallidiroseus]